MASLARCCSTHGAQSAPRARKARLCRRAAVTRGACRPPSREQRRPARAQPGRVRQSRRTEGVGAWPHRPRVHAAAAQQQLDLLVLTDLPSPGRIVFPGLFSTGWLAILRARRAHRRASGRGAGRRRW